nr:uncharacterized protein LOC108008694 [Drosophila suzukii]
MNSHLIAILLATVAIGSSIANPSLLSGPSRIMEIMSATSEMQRNNPQLAAACFNYYDGVFKNDWSIYEDEYNQCVDKYEGGHKEVLRQYDSVVWDLSNSTFDSCMFLLDCDNKNDSQKALSCYAVEGPKYAKNLTAVGSSASVFYGSLGQEIEQLAYTRELCCNTSARNYEVRSGNSYEAFQSCMAGLSPVPVDTTTSRPISSTSPPPTTQQSTTQSSSSAPQITTVRPNQSSHIESEVRSSANNNHRLARKLESIYRHVV